MIYNPGLSLCFPLHPKHYTFILPEKNWETERKIKKMEIEREKGKSAAFSCITKHDGYIKEWWWYG